jgi:hypothetical protein
VFHCDNVALNCRTHRLLWRPPFCYCNAIISSVIQLFFAPQMQLLIARSHLIHVAAAVGRISLAGSSCVYSEPPASVSSLNAHDATLSVISTRPCCHKKVRSPLRYCDATHM